MKSSESKAWRGKSDVFVEKTQYLLINLGNARAETLNYRAIRDEDAL
ncbi:MAG: hypothetical protein ACKOZY_06940 [Flavobacteriales bacterium]